MKLNELLTEGYSPVSFWVEVATGNTSTPPLNADDLHGNPPEELRQKFNTLNKSFFDRETISQADANAIIKDINEWENPAENQRMRTSYVNYDVGGPSSEYSLPTLNVNVDCEGTLPFGMIGGWIRVIKHQVKETLKRLGKDVDTFSIYISKE